MSLANSDALDRVFQGLKSKNEAIRLKSSYELHSLVAAVARGDQPPTTGERAR